MTVKISKPYWTRQEIRELMNLWQDGKSNRDIAAELKRTELAVVTKLSRLGMRRPTRQEPGLWIVQRPCLCCGKNFPSTDRFNRICKECKKQYDWDNGGMTIRLGGSREPTS